jgi:hypothetical protein
MIATSKTIREVAVAYCVGPEILWNWLNKYQPANGGTEVDLTMTERTGSGSSSGSWLIFEQRRCSSKASLELPPVWRTPSPCHRSKCWPGETGPVDG